MGIYGGRPPKTPWSRTAREKFQEDLKSPDSLKVDLEPSGSFVVDSYTVSHAREGGPETGILCGRTEAGRRAWAQTPKGDTDVLTAMESEEWVGRRGRFTGRAGKVNIVEFK